MAEYIKLQCGKHYGIREAEESLTCHKCTPKIHRTWKYRGKGVDYFKDDVPSKCHVKDAAKRPIDMDWR